MRHCIAWGQEGAGSDGEYATIDAITDGVIFSEGDDIRIPADLSMLIGMAVINTNTQSGSARITSPRLRRRANIYAPLITQDGAVDDAFPYLQWARSPIVLNPEESVRFQRNVGTVSGTTSICVCEIADGPQTPMDGDFIIIRCTATASVPALAWTNATLQFEEQLPASYYDVLGMTWVGTGLVAARLQLPGFPYRPGSICRANGYVTPDPMTMYGGAGSWGRFHINQPPSIDFLAHTASTSQAGYLVLREV